MRNIKDLHPKLQSIIPKLQAECERQGLIIKIADCLRTVKEQNAEYAKGRTASGNIVTNARGDTYSSMHQWGVAFDFYRNDSKYIYDTSGKFFDKVGAIGKSLGLFWGGDFKSLRGDLAHFQLPYWGETPTRLKQLYKTPEEFFKTWKEETTEMTEEERRKFNEMVRICENLTKSRETVYHYTAELPDWARPTIQKLMNKGLYAGASESDLNLPENLMRTLVINDRAGLYD